MSYLPHTRFAAPALPTADLPRLVVGVIAIEGLYSALQWVFDAGLDMLPGNASHAVFYGDTRLGLWAQLFSFGFLALSVVLVARMGHRRGFFTLTGPPVTGLRHLWLGFLAVTALVLATEALPPYWDTDQIAQVRSPALWVITLPLSLLALCVQTGAEELFYRGYIQQQIAARFKSPWVWMIVPNIMFGLAHWETGDFSVPGLQYLLWAFVFGLAASDLTARTGTLGAAIGFHLANNAYAFLLFAERAGPDSGLALIWFKEGALGAGSAPQAPFWSVPFLVELSGIGLMWLAVRIAMRR